MFRMNQKHQKRWERIRRKGRRHFIWIRGVLVWGIIVAVFWSFWMSLMLGKPFRDNLALALIVFPIAGYFWGIWTWRLCERQFHEATKEGKA